jgi:hypothetical protein
MMVQEFEKIGKKIQEAIEDTFANEPSGICFLTGFCVNEVLQSHGFKSRKVTGKLALMNRTGKKYIVYGKLNGINVGDYHTWCEVEHEGKIYIIDPSLKYNIKYLSTNKIGLSKSIPEILVSVEKNTFNWKYIEDSKLERYSLSYLETVPPDAIESILNNCISI